MNNSSSTSQHQDNNIVPMKELLNVIDEAFIMINEYEEILEANHQARTLLKYKNDEIGKFRFSQLYRPAPDLPQEHSWQLLPAGKSIIQKGSLKLKDNSLLPVELKFNALMSNKNKYFFITIRKLKEQQTSPLTNTLILSDKDIVLDNIPARIVQMDSNKNILWVNNMAAQKSGLNKNELIGYSCKDVWPPENNQCESCPSTIALKTGKITEGEVKSKNGQVLLIRSCPTIDENNNITGVIEIRQDISLQKQYQNELQASTIQLQDRINELNCIFTISNIIERPDITVDQICNEIVEIIPKSFRHPHHIHCQIVYRNNEYASENFTESNYKINYIIYSHGVNVGKINIYNTDPNIDHQKPFSQDEKHLIKDISERLGLVITRHQESKILKATNDFMRSIMESVNNAIFALDLDGHITIISKAAESITGYSPDELTDKPFALLFNRADYQQIHTQIAKITVLGLSYNQNEIELIKKDGSKMFVSVNLSPLKEDGVIVSIVGTIEDISKRKQLEQQLFQAQKLESIGQLAAGIAHEINTPIQYIGDNTQFFRDAFNDISSFLDITKNMLLGSESELRLNEQIDQLNDLMQTLDLDYLTSEIPTAIEQTLSGVDRVSKIVLAMKEFSHPGKGELIAQDINKAIESTITVARNEWKYLAQLESDLDKSLPMVYCYPGELNQVILNMIINAAHAIEDQIKNEVYKRGEIRISTQHNKGWLEIRISDNGSGIPDHVQPRIFDPFFTTKEVGTGSGQGLAIAHSIITDKHKGKISFETNPNEGTTFIIQIPINPEEIE